MKALASKQDVSQLDFGIVVARLELHYGFEKEFGVVKNTRSRCDLGHQPHTFNVRFILLQKVTAETLRISKSIGGKVADYGTKFTGKRCKKLDLLARLLRSSVVYPSVVRCYKFPAIDQRPVTLHGHLERGHSLLLAL